MKTLVSLIMIFCLTGKVLPQGVDNLLSQSSTDISLIKDQIAALEAGSEILSHGVELIQKGLLSVGGLKNDAFDLHCNYFGSLRLVNPNLVRYTGVADIIGYGESIVSCLKKFTAPAKLTPAENGYLRLVCKSISASSARSLTELDELLTDNYFQLEDEERTLRIHNIYLELREKYVFTKTFIQGAIRLSRERQNEKKEINFLKIPE